MIGHRATKIFSHELTPVRRPPARPPDSRDWLRLRHLLWEGDDHTDEIARYFTASLLNTSVNCRLLLINTSVIAINYGN